MLQCVGWAVTGWTSHSQAWPVSCSHSELESLRARPGRASLAFTMWVSGTSPACPASVTMDLPGPIRGRDLVRADQWEAGTPGPASVWERLLLLDTGGAGLEDRQGEDNSLNHSSQINTSSLIIISGVHSFMGCVSFVKIRQTDSHALEKADKQPTALTTHLSPFPFPSFSV